MPFGSCPGIFYGQAKVHKPAINNCPSFRTIPEGINPPSYSIKVISNSEKEAFETSVYRKSKFKGVFTNLKSFIPMTYKTGLWQTVILLFFNMLFLRKVSPGNCQTQEIFKQNSYPEKFIDWGVESF